MDSSYKDTDVSDKLKSKFTKDPMAAVGFIAIAGVLGYGAYAIKKSKGKPLSLQLIHLRLAVQGTFVGCLTFGVIYSFCKQHFGLFQSEKKN